jgi:hypothetical protein
MKIRKKSFRIELQLTFSSTNAYKYKQLVKRLQTLCATDIWNLSCSSYTGIPVTDDDFP